MKNALLVLVALVLVACDPAPPASYAIDPAFSPEQAEVIRDVVRAWCESARAFCPAELAWGAAEAEIHADADYGRHGRQGGSFAFADRYAPGVWVDVASPWAGDLHVFWRGLAHEFGHLAGLDGHGHGLELMSAEPDPYGPLAVE